ncbi:acetyltransferase component of pyruvate dehydrogenase complex [Cnuibacter physcomitrellae]|uniref:Dihydrolipoamide acetyltransferase component of pyruvate dehydrogenase complex n=1 Tax=Cnuibacter physcomitrellae TaxID=1619308 RepID=A0A1X9LU24_9MICO|nr:dihydrolipoamide acetyltransferase family protein [Cnuibacter physcomitrellae]ARJ06719.1 hypothetical protein B5808_16930 [Cnuibacter physcomitrellae]GGI38675.1 acetyltransferase component of pyruvate dehydrogenase complex [Cnuibacter physcomitrellae]
MAAVVRMPSVLAGAEEAAIASWLVSEGDSVAIGDPIAEIETEKAVVEYSAEAAGVVGRVLIGAGESAEIGVPIAVLLAEGDSPADVDRALGVDSAPDAASTPAPEAVPSTPERDPESASPVVEAESVAEAPVVTGALPSPGDAASTSTSADPSAGSGDRVFASPIARKMARDLGLDVDEVEGTGPGGRIVRRDVQRASASASRVAAAPGTIPTTPPAPETSPADRTPASPPSAPVADDATELIPHTGMRRAIARRLTESKSTVPHFYLTTEARVDDLLALRERVNASSPRRVSVNDLILKAVAAAFGDVPEANVTWSDDGLVVHRTVDIGVAIATEGGLVTPVVRDVQRTSLTEVSRTVADLAERSRDRRIKQHELEGGSFAVSNLGMYGTLEFAAILNPPQSGILAVGAARQQAVVVDGRLEVGTVLRCTLSVDHRAVDGALAARWLAAFTSRLEDPLGILI